MLGNCLVAFEKKKVTWFVMELYNFKFNLWPEHLALNGLKPCSISKGIKRNSKYLTKVTENYNDAKTTSTVLERNRHSINFVSPRCIGQ